METNTALDIGTFDLGDVKVAPCKYNELYLVFSNGMLYSGNSEKFVCPSTNGRKSPYLYYYITDKNKKRNKIYVHRLVAEHFLDNPMNLRDVHHKDSNPKNNDISNLEWLSHKDNCRLKPFINPFHNIKENDMAYLNKISGDTYRFIIKKSRLFPYHSHQSKDLKYLKNYRDNFFLTNLGDAWNSNQRLLV